MTPSDCKPVLLFDVNETLLELSVFQPFFSRVFGDAQALRRWFDQVVIMSSAMTLSGQYADSATIGLAALKMMAEVAQMRLQERDVEAFRKAAASQVTYADVTPALTALRGAGFRMVTLSNNSRQATDEALQRNDILCFFERTFSIDDHIHSFKPARAAYEWVSSELGIAPGELCLVSCHAFDVLGAAGAGLKTAMVLREGNAPIGLGMSPLALRANLEQLALALIAEYFENVQSSRSKDDARSFGEHVSFESSNKLHRHSFSVSPSKAIVTG